MDHQLITIQEMPERAPPGQLPRSVEIVLDHDLVDVCKAGDRVRVVGVYRALPTASKGGTKKEGEADTRTIFHTRVLANSVALLNKDRIGSHTAMTDVDIENIQRIAAEASSGRHLIQSLAQSIAPSIFCHDK